MSASRMGDAAARWVLARTRRRGHRERVQRGREAVRVALRHAIRRGCLVAPARVRDDLGVRGFARGAARHRAGGEGIHRVRVHGRERVSGRHGACRRDAGARRRPGRPRGGCASELRRRWVRARRRRRRGRREGTMAPGGLLAARHETHGTSERRFRSPRRVHRKARSENRDRRRSRFSRRPKGHSGFNRAFSNTGREKIPKFIRLVLQSVFLDRDRWFRGAWGGGARYYDS